MALSSNTRIILCASLEYSFNLLPIHRSLSIIICLYLPIPCNSLIKSSIFSSFISSISRAILASLKKSSPSLLFTTLLSIFSGTFCFLLLIAYIISSNPIPPSPSIKSLDVFRSSKFKYKVGIPCIASLFPYAIASDVAPAPPFTGIKTSTRVLFPSLNLYAISPFDESARIFKISLYIFSGFLNLFTAFILFFRSIKSLSHRYATPIFSV